jgi:elongation factor 3
MRLALAQPLLREEEGADSAQRSNARLGKTGFALFSLVIGFGCAAFLCSVEQSTGGGVPSFLAAMMADQIPEVSVQIGMPESKIGGAVPEPAIAKASKAAPFEQGDLKDSVVLSSGVRMPRLIFQTVCDGKHGENTEACVLNAVRAGFKGLDTVGQPSDNKEVAVGAALAELFKTGVKRESLFIQVQVNPKYAAELNPSEPVQKQVEMSIAASLKALGLEYLDSVVLHSAYPEHEDTMAAWGAMESAVNSGSVKQLGIWNVVSLSQLRKIYQQATVKPAVVQQNFCADAGSEAEMRAWCAEAGVYVQSFWSDVLVTERKVISSTTVTDLAKKYSVESSMLFLRYVMGLGGVPLIPMDDKYADYLAASKVPLTAKDAEMIGELVKQTGREDQQAACKACSLPPPVDLAAAVAPTSGGEKFTHLACKASMTAVRKTEIDELAGQIEKKESAAAALEGLVQAAKDKSAAAEPFLVNAFPAILDATKNKKKEVQEAAVLAGQAVIEGMSPYAVDLILPTILKGIDQSAPPAQKMATCKFITSLAARAPKAIGYLLVSLVTPVAELTCEVNPKVQDAGLNCFSSICNYTGNKDLEPFLPYVTQAASSLDNTHACVEKLAGCIFVQNVETPALAAMLPVLSRGLTDKKEEVIRTCAKIVDNMCKVVDDPAEILPVMPIMEPLVVAAVEKIANPEARGVAEKALKTLRKAAEGAVPKRIKLEEAQTILKKALGDKAEAGEAFEAVATHVASCAATATNMNAFEPEAWKAFAGIAPFSDVIDTVRQQMEVASAKEDEWEEDTEDGQDLYKGGFSLAYGTLTLLRDAKLHLKRNRFYGLLGPNQCGKTTLMRAIANEQLEGFPKRDELKSVFVEHEIADEEVGVQDDGFPILSVDKPGWWWVMHTCNDVYKVATPVTEEQVKDLMKSIGFGYPGGPDRAANLEDPVTMYSGGWKMKMQLCAAQLMNADVLMLDEPTGHLDVDNILWLENWLAAFPGSVITTSHYSPFLDKMCTHIIDFQDRKLRTFKGAEKGRTLTEFVEKFPEKKAYFELTNEAFKFVFPEPGALEGAKTRSKIVLRMNDITFQYPSKDKPTIFDVSLTVSQLSRVAVIGANGAGKSTAIKVLVGEEIPTSGTVWKAPGLRMAYVAQHAFHHLEKHMQSTPSQYIMWRFAGADDKESVEFKSTSLSVDEAKARNQTWCLDTVTGRMRRTVKREEDAKRAKADEAMALTPDSVCGRKFIKKEKTYEYDVKWVGKSVDSNVWVEKDVLLAMGYKKMV